MAKLEPVLEYCECGCKSVKPYCPVCHENPDCHVHYQLSKPDEQKFCQECGTEFDWSNLECTDTYYNNWRRKTNGDTL